MHNLILFVLAIGYGYLYLIFLSLTGISFLTFNIPLLFLFGFVTFLFSPFLLSIILLLLQNKKSFVKILIILFVSYPIYSILYNMIPLSFLPGSPNPTTFFLTTQEKGINYYFSSYFLGYELPIIIYSMISIFFAVGTGYAIGSLIRNKLASKNFYEGTTYIKIKKWAVFYTILIFLACSFPFLSFMTSIFTTPINKNISNLAYIAVSQGNLNYDNKLFVYDTSNWQKLKEINVGMGDYFNYFPSQDKKIIYAMNYNTGNVGIRMLKIKAQNAEILKYFSVTKTLGEVSDNVFLIKNKLYFLNPFFSFYSYHYPKAKIFIVNTDTFALENTIEIYSPINAGIMSPNISQDGSIITFTSRDKKTYKDKVVSYNLLSKQIISEKDETTESPKYQDNYLWETENYIWKEIEFDKTSHKYKLMIYDKKNVLIKEILLPYSTKIKGVIEISNH